MSALELSLFAAQRVVEQTEDTERSGMTFTSLLLFIIQQYYHSLPSSSRSDGIHNTASTVHLVLTLCSKLIQTSSAMYSI